MRHEWLAALAGWSCALHSACGPAAGAMAREEQRPVEPAALETAPAPREPAVEEISIDEPRPAPLAAGQTVRIPAGPLNVGSATGSEGRDPSREADQVTLQVGAFEIDRLPYPNDPAAPPRTALNRAEAQALCERAGKRLCHELEWERACAGAADDAFMGGSALDVGACRKQPERCASEDGVHAMGVALREWTASDAPGGLGNSMRTAVLRGAGADAPEGAHRCAAREAATPDSTAENLGFRCCSGQAQTLAYPTEPRRPLTAAAELDLDAQREALRAVPQLAAHAADFRPFSRADVDAALRRGRRSRSGITYWRILPSVLHWSPVHGEELLVLSGSVKRGALVAVLHVLGDDRYSHAASTVITETDTSIALGISEQHPKQLTWSTCFDCPGEGGAIVWGEDARVRFGFR